MRAYAGATAWTVASSLRYMDLPNIPAVIRPTVCRGGTVCHCKPAGTACRVSNCRCVLVPLPSEADLAVAKTPPPPQLCVEGEVCGRPADGPDKPCSYCRSVLTKDVEDMWPVGSTVPALVHPPDLRQMQNVFTASRAVTRAVRASGSSPGPLTALLDALSQALGDGPLFTPGRGPEGHTKGTP